jgi:hypothetical protein
MQPLVPYRFDPSPNEFDVHFREEQVPGGVFVTWPITGTRLFVPDGRVVHLMPTHEDLTAGNRGLFKAHGWSGFSIGTYHEFLITVGTERDVTFRMGTVEASFGNATPLAALVFNAYHRAKYFGSWDEIRSVRLIGVGMDEAEAAFLNACASYEARFGALPVLYPIDEDTLAAFWFQEVEDPEPEYVTAPPMTTNIEPLRFFYSGVAQADDAGACIYFYRVLEYFSFFTNAAEMRRLRHDGNVSDAEFSRRVLDLMSRDEKGPIFKLIASLADHEILGIATSEGLIQKAAAPLLADAVYALRNSIVHGKFSYGYALHSDSVLEPDPRLSRWRMLLRKMAHQAISQYGAKRT